MSAPNKGTNKVKETAAAAVVVAEDPALAEFKIQRGFIRKTFIVLLLELVFTLFALQIVVFVPNARHHLTENKSLAQGLGIGAIIMNMIVNLCLSFFPKFREPPLAIAASAIGVVSMTTILVLVAVKHDVQVVVLALFTTTILVLFLLCLSLTKLDFTKYGIYVIALGVSTLLIIVFSAIMENIAHKITMLDLVATFLSVIFYSMVMLVVLQMILGSKKEAFETQQHYFAAYALYASSVMLMMTAFKIVDFGTLGPVATPNTPAQ